MEHHADTLASTYTEDTGGGGRYWTNKQYIGVCLQLMNTMASEMEMFVSHSDHVIYHKRQMRTLLERFSHTDLVIKCDFIQNIVHSRGRETSQSFYSKHQTQFLSFVVWFYNPVDGEMTKQKMYVDYLSSYLKHNSMFFQKCFAHLISYLRDQLGIEFNKVYSLLHAETTILST